MSELSKTYAPTEIEIKWYDIWEKGKYFSSVPDDREPFTIVMPPPNITGVLHMGHMLNLTIQDILIRRARLQGKNACWIPGTDHASIATESKVVKWLRDEKGLKKSDISRDTFLEYAWLWKENYGNIILNQIKKLGASCDWDRTAFTMDDVRSEGVIKAFVDLYKKGLLYRGQRMVNWDSQAKTVLSNEEVIYNEENAKLFRIKYFSDTNPELFITIATQRPETIMADAAIAVHPDDERYKHFIGQDFKIPLIDKKIKVIADKYVDKDFGTGALKITPAHDINDYEIGVKHQLEIISILDESGLLNDSALILIGQDRFEARKNIVQMLDQSGYLDGFIEYKTNIGRSERTNSIIEPRISLQWFVDTKSLTKPALDAVQQNDITFFPRNQINTYVHWLENIRDWCISRQLWWGHRIPAYYYDDYIFVAESLEEAQIQAKNKLGALYNPDLLRQDEDAIDTWFSSWLWPITVFDGFNNSKDFQYYYPTNVLVTGWDIIFLWVARMIMAGFEWKDKKPFHDVYFTGMVRDKQRKKMSKSLGNSPDALELIHKYGADGVRFGMLSSSPAGADLLFDEKLCEQGRNFCNKIWNALRLVKSWEVTEAPASFSTSLVNDLASQFMRNATAEFFIEQEENFKNYRLSENLISLYSLIWTDFCSWYIEIIKPEFEKPIDKTSYNQVISILSELMVLLNPFMPFITEEIYQQLNSSTNESPIITAKYTIHKIFDPKISKQFTIFKDIISTIRDVRNKYSLKQRFIIPTCFQDLKLGTQEQAFNALLEHFGFIKITNIHEINNSHTITNLVHTIKFECEIPSEFFNNHMDQNDILEKIKYFEGFVMNLNKKLNNESFVKNAPQEVLNKEQKKLQDSLQNIENLKSSLKS